MEDNNIKVFEEMKGKKVSQVFVDKDESRLFSMSDGSYFKMQPVSDKVELFSGFDSDLKYGEVYNVQYLSKSETTELEKLQIFSTYSPDSYDKETVILIETDHGDAKYIWAINNADNDETIQGPLVKMFYATKEQVKAEIARRSKEDIKDEHKLPIDFYEYEKDRPVRRPKNSSDNFLTTVRFYDKEENTIYYGSKINKSINPKKYHDISVTDKGLEVLVWGEGASYKLRPDVAISRFDINKRFIYVNDIVRITGAVSEIGCVKYNKDLSAFVVRVYDEFEYDGYIDIEFDIFEDDFSLKQELEFEVLGTVYFLSEIDELDENAKKIFSHNNL